jgi:simple sugar transport system substrate-binding protein
VTKVAIATPGKANDYGWAQQGIKSAKVAAAAYGAKVSPIITNIGYDKTPVVLTQLAKGGAGFVIAHASGYDTDAAKIGPQYKVPMMTYDDPKLLVKNYVSNITTQSQEGAYLAGILAAKTTKQHKLGIVISATDLPCSLGVEVHSFLLDFICIISPHEAEPFGYFARSLVNFA